jgi:hypothetical protein
MTFAKITAIINSIASSFTFISPAINQARIDSLGMSSIHPLAASITGCLSNLFFILLE